MKLQIWLVQLRVGGRAGLPTRIFDVHPNDRHGSHDRANPSTSALQKAFARPMAKVIRFSMSSMISSVTSAARSVLHGLWTARGRSGAAAVVQGPRGGVWMGQAIKY